jgi:hypothetical protein
MKYPEGGGSHGYQNIEKSNFLHEEALETVNHQSEGKREGKHPQAYARGNPQHRYCPRAKPREERDSKALATATVAREVVRQWRANPLVFEGITTYPVTVVVAHYSPYARICVALRQQNSLQPNGW